MSDTTLIRVALPSGSTLEVMVEREAEFITERVERYTTEYRLTNISDLAELDRVVVGEMLAQRYMSWLSAGQTYAGTPFDDFALRKDLKDLSFELRQVKKALVIDKINRDKQRGEGSVHQYIAKLLSAAKELGVHREHQLDKALELVNELFGMTTFQKNASPDQQKEFGATPEDIVTWIRDVMWPEYDAIDAHFREHQQKYWVRDM